MDEEIQSQPYINMTNEKEMAWQCCPPHQQISTFCMGSTALRRGCYQWYKTTTTQFVWYYPSRQHTGEDAEPTIRTVTTKVRQSITEVWINLPANLILTVTPNLPLVFQGVNLAFFATPIRVQHKPFANTVALCVSDAEILRRVIFL